MTLHDDELDAILARDAARQATIKPGLSTRDHPSFMPLYCLLKAHLSQPGINNGNVYPDELADALLKTGRVKVRPATEPRFLRL